MASWLKIYPNAKLTAPDVVVAVRAKLLNCHTKIKKLSKIAGGASTSGSQQEGSSTPSTPASSVNRSKSTTPTSQRGAGTGDEDDDVSF